MKQLSKNAEKNVCKFSVLILDLSFHTPWQGWSPNSSGQVTMTVGGPPAINITTRCSILLSFFLHWISFRRISGKGVYWGKGESHEFSKKAWKPVVPIGLLLLLPKKSLGWVKNVTFWVIQKNMKFDRKCVENVWYSRAFISSTKV